MKQHTVSLFPYLLARISGGSLTEFEKLNLRQTLVILNSLEKLQSNMDIIKEAISKDLHSFIATVSDTKERNFFIQFRRDIHNERPSLLPSQYKKILPDSLQKEIENYEVLYTKKHQLLRKGELCFEKEQKQNKDIFLKLLKKHNFQNGILLASSTLPESLELYLHEKNKKLPKIERSLMKYLSRMYTKPSPFSTFTSLSFATFSNNDTITTKGSRLRGESYVELNHQLFHYFLGLLIQNKEVRRDLTIKRNPTLRLSDHQFVFFVNNFNKESIQRINTTPALEYINFLIQKKKTWLYKEFVNELLKGKFTEIPKKEIEKYINSLLLYGFIEYDIEISGLDYNWDKKLSQLIHPLIKQFPYLAQLEKTLTFLRNSAKAYAKAQTGKREKLLHDAFNNIRETSLLLHTAAGLPEKERVSFIDGFHQEVKKEKNRGKRDELFTYEYKTDFTLKLHKLWYEDTMLTSSFLLSTQIEKELLVLGNLLSRTGWFDTCTEKIYELTEFFKKHYQPTETVEFLQFYEKYYREKEKKQKKTFPSVEASKKRNDEYLRIFTASLNKKLSNSDSLTITQKDIEHIPKAYSSASFSAFFHVLSEKNGKQKIVINSTAPGFGKLYSRFLPLFPTELTKTIREWNAMDKEAMMAEATDASVFNANLHPNLMPFAITFPGSYTMGSGQEQIPLTDIEIIYIKQEGRIQLRHRHSKKTIFGFDMGFQGYKGRSELFEFLAIFGFGSHHNTHQLLQEVNKQLQKANKKNTTITILPRITYEDTIILQRKRWEFMKSVLPLRNPQENDWVYYQKVFHWKNELRLPEEIFIKVGHNKPQYINFSNPFLVTILEKMIEKIKEKEIIKIEEMLPASQEIAGFNGRKVITEFLTQWYQYYQQ